MPDQLTIHLEAVNLYVKDKLSWQGDEIVHLQARADFTYIAHNAFLTGVLACKSDHATFEDAISAMLAFFGTQNDSRLRILRRITHYDFSLFIACSDAMV